MSAQNVSTYSFTQFATLDEATRAPADVLAAAWAEAEQIRERARSEGEAAGYQSGLERAESEFKPIAESVVRALGDAASALGATRDELVENLTRQSAEISLQIGEHITAGAFEFQPELVIDVTRAAIRRLGERHRLTVLVSAEDLERVSESIERLRGEMGGIEYLDVQADRRVHPGGVIVETEYGEIDATTATQMQNARAIVAAGLVGDASLRTDEHGETTDAEPSDAI